MNAMPVNWTISHSNHTAECPIELLREYGMTAVADVRTSPYAAYGSQFDRAQLHRILESAEICYVFLGAGVDGRPTDLKMCAASDHIQYDLGAASVTFAAGLALDS